jgi:predicted metalloprotease
MGRVAVKGGFGAVLLLLLCMFLGLDVTNLGGGQLAPHNTAEQRQAPAEQAVLPEDEARRIISRVLAQTGQVWRKTSP